MSQESSENTPNSVNIAQMLAAAKKLAYSAPREKKEELFRSVVAMQDALVAMPDAIGDHPRDRASALANIGVRLQHRGQYQEAADYYTRAQFFQEDDYIKSLRAECVAALGQFEAACRLYAEVNVELFSRIECDSGAPRSAILYEKAS